MSFAAWKEYFDFNKDHFDHIKEYKKELSQKEKDTIFTSIQQFQKGENSEGKNLLKFAKSSGIPDYYETIKVFIKEEQSHAKVLGKFMNANEIPKIRSHWIDSIFRKLRLLGGLENSVIVLITAEIIAAVYYIALRDATSSTTLKKICNQILIDEEMHINFQSSLLNHTYQKQNRLMKFISRTKHRVLMLGTSFVVWQWHKKVFKAGSYRFLDFLNAVFAEFFRAERMIIGMKNIYTPKIHNHKVLH